MENIVLSVVLPLLNEEKSIQFVCQKLTIVLESITDQYEVIFVDDGSKDDTFSIICSINKENPKIKGISFSRNFGHQIALFAGLKHSNGEAVVTMDGDGQHPPELIKDLFEKYLDGYDIVNTRRIDEASISWFKKNTSKLYYRLINSISEVRIEPGSADFRLMNQRAVNAFLGIPESDRFTRGLVVWMGFRQTVIDYQALSRHSGSSKFSLSKMVRLGLNGITSFSSRPLRLSLYTGFFISFSGFLYAIYALVKYFSGYTVTGWTSVLLSILIIGGVILVSLGIIGEYIARIFNEVKKRPLYFIKDTTDNFSKKI